MKQKFKRFRKIWVETSAQARYWKHLNAKQKLATGIVVGTTGAVSGSATGALFSPKGKRKQGAFLGGAVGPLTGGVGGLVVAGSFQINQAIKKRKRRRKRK